MSMPNSYYYDDYYDELEWMDNADYDGHSVSYLGIPEIERTYHWLI